MLSQIYIDLHVKYSLFFSDFNENYIFVKLLNFKENLPLEGEFFCADIQRVGQREGGTEMTKPIVAFRNFVNAPKNLKKNTKPCCH
jgi:hypothetical protein